MDLLIAPNVMLECMIRQVWIMFEAHFTALSITLDVPMLMFTSCI